VSKVNSDTGQAAWQGTRPETARGCGNTGTLFTAIARPANLQEVFTQRHKPWAWCWHPGLPASLATACPPCGSSGASRELLRVAPNSFCPLCLRCWQQHLGTIRAALNHLVCSILSTSLRSTKQESLFVAGEVIAVMGEVPHPCDLWLIKAVRIRVFFQALAQRAQDTAPLLASLPLTHRGWAQRALGLFRALNWGLRMLVYSWFPVWVLVGACWPGFSSTHSFCEAFHSLYAFPALWLLPALRCPGSWRDTRAICPVYRHRPTP